MAGTFKGLTQSQINKSIKEGRGQVTGSNYKPLFTNGRYIPQGAPTGYSVINPSAFITFFRILNWLPQVYDFREQFPLRVDDTARIADSCELLVWEIGAISRLPNSVSERARFFHPGIRKPVV